ncbi:MAG: hypothetical protein PUF02_05240 [Collinsella sp.]|nr:hypothetical protein [Collinsella sp.]
MIEKMQLPRGAKPLVYLANGALAFSIGERICVLDVDGRWTVRALLENASGKSRLCRGRMASRALRWEVRCAVEVDGGLLVSWRGALLHCDLCTGDVRNVFSARRGFSTPLTIQSTDGEVEAVWGDYGQNPEKKAVGIYGFSHDGGLRTLYEFPAGVVRHVHGFTPRLAGGWYVFTGDTEETAGLYVASADFSSVEPLAVGDQRFRAVRGYDTAEGLIYATDSSIIKNHVYLLPNEDASLLRALADTNGPCIYGTPCEAGYLFSTTVEPDERIRGVSSYLSAKLGPGVLTRETQVLLVTNTAEVREVLRLKKDVYPMKLMQYGSVQFASGQDRRRNVACFCRSLSDLDAIPIEIRVS